MMSCKHPNVKYTSIVKLVPIFMLLVLFACKKGQTDAPITNNTNIDTLSADKRDSLVGTYTGITEMKIENIYYWFQSGEWRDSSAFYYSTIYDTISISKGTSSEINVTSQKYNTIFLDTVKLDDTFKIPEQQIIIELGGIFRFAGTGNINIDSSVKTKFHIKTYYALYGHDICGGQDKKTTFSSTVEFYKK